MNLQQTKGCMSLQPDCRVVVLLLRIRLCFVPILFALSVLCVPQAAQAAITFSNATLVAATDETDESDETDAHVYALTADASVQLNPTIEQGLANGVPLHFTVQFEIHQPVRWWFDKRILTFIERYSLVYYELTRHYRVSTQDRERSRNFRSLLDALDYLGSVRDVSVSSPRNLTDGQKYLGRLQLSLDQNSLPLALQPVAFVSSAWRLQSEEYRWQIN